MRRIRPELISDDLTLESYDADLVLVDWENYKLVRREDVLIQVRLESL